MIDAQDVLTRIQQLGVDALASLSTPVTGYGVAYVNHTQDQYPYFVTFVQSWQDNANNFERSDIIVNVALRLIVGTYTEGAPGDMENNLNSWMFAIPRYINQRMSLETSTNTSDVSDLVYAQCLQGQGLQIFGTSGVGTQTVGTTYIVECHFTETFDQSAY